MVETELSLVAAPLAFAAGSWIFLIFVVLLLGALIFGYYTRSGSGISQTPYRRESGPTETPSELAHDVTQHVSDWERGTAGHHERHRPPAVHTPVDPAVEEALVRWREGSGAHGHLDPPVGTGDHVRGPENATPVAIYLDLASEPCRHTYRLLADLGERQPLRLAVRHLPLADAHELALPAAETLEAAAAQGQFFEVLDELADGGFEDETELLGLASSRVSDPDRLRLEMADGRYRPLVVEHIRQAIASGAHGIPAVYINGLRYDGDLEPDDLSRALGPTV
jgi:hypothetical protein